MNKLLNIIRHWFEPKHSSVWTKCKGGQKCKDGQWHHICVVHKPFSRANITVYVDGQQADTPGAITGLGFQKAAWLYHKGEGEMAEPIAGAG